MSERGFPSRKLILGLATLGALLSLVLEYTHYRAYVAPAAGSFCSLGERVDCVSVALSKYGVWLGVPLALWGFVGFVAIGLAAWQRSRWLLPLTAVASVASVVLLGLSVFRIGALCLWCEAVHLTSFALFALAWQARRADQVPLRAVEPAAIVLLPPIGVLVAIALFLPAYWGVFGWKGELPFAHGKTADGHPWIGAREPKLTLEEFTDYSCPHCKAASNSNLMRVAKHPSELRLVRRQYPRTPCVPRSEVRCLAARVAVCADEQEKFWQADRWLFEHSATGIPDLGEAVRDLGLDPQRLASCVERDSTFDYVAAEWKRAKKLRIPGTPYYAQGDEILPAAAAAALMDAL